MDAAGQFLVDLEDLPDLAVLPLGGLRAGVFQRQAVLVDPLVGGAIGLAVLGTVAWTTVADSVRTQVAHAAAAAGRPLP